MKARPCVLILLAVGFGMPATLHGQSLGEIAKKTQEQRQKDEAQKAKESEKAKADGAKDSAKTTTAPKTYRNNDLVVDPTAPAAMAAPPSATPPPSSATADHSEESKDAPSAVPMTDSAAAHVKDEAWWRSTMSALRAKVATDQSACTAKTELVAKLSRMLDDMPDTAPAIVAGGYISASATLAADLAKARSEVQGCEGMVAVDKKAITDLEEEARRLSVLPGWLRDR